MTKKRHSATIGKIVDGEISLDIEPRGFRTAKYSVEKKILAKTLRAQGYSYGQMAEVMGVSTSTLHDWINEIPSDEQALLRENDLSEKIERGLASKALQLSNLSLSAVNDADLSKASLVQKAVTAKICFEIAQLSRGKATQNIHVLSQSVTTRDAAIDTLDSERDSLERRLGGSQVIDVDNENDDLNNDE